jgi:hypothetical protein
VGLPDFTKIVAHNGPAVVNVRVVGSTKVAQRQQMPQMSTKTIPSLNSSDASSRSSRAAMVAAGNSFSALDRASL